MKNYNDWYTSTSNNEEKVFDMCQKAQAKINSSIVDYECILNDANEWQQNVDAIILIKKTEYSNIKCGDSIEIDSKNYIVYFEPEDRDFFWSAKMRLCNNTLKFYNRSGISSQTEYHEIPCIFSDGSISQDEGRFMNLPSGHYMVTIPSGTITKSDLKLRFILNDAPYRIEGINNATNGLVKIEIVDDVFIDDDNRELGIADWKKYQIIREVSILNGATSTLLYTNATLQLNIEAKENGVIVTNPTVAYISSNTYVCTVSNIGLITALGTGDSIVTVNFGDSSDTIAIHSDMTIANNYNLVITPTDTFINSGKSKLFSTTVMNNGVEDTEKLVSWTLTNKDGTSNNYCSIVYENKNCTITASNLYSAVNKVVILRAYLDSDISKFKEVELTIKSLI